MPVTLRNILSIFAGVIIGSIVNMAIVMISGKFIPPPEGADITTMEGLKASMHLFEPKHFIMPFLAHAVGTLVGAFITAKVAATHHMQFALAIGFLFLLGGVANTFMLPSPIWYTALDLIGAYFPMAYIGGKLAVRNKIA
jgi:hypothetical protein